jgi:hypothetical protein
MRFLFALAFFIPMTASSTRNLPSVTKETLVGTWEAVMPMEAVGGMGAGLYRMEIRGNSDSSLVGVVFAPSGSVVQFLSRSIGLEVSHAELKLHFQTLPPEKDWKPEEIVFTGSGVAEADGGALHGTLSKDGVPVGADEIWFLKGSWTRGFGEASQKADEALQKLRRDQKT